ncbi:MAG: hypothetical protein WBA76_12040 [Phormidesmis sp.]
MPWLQEVILRPEDTPAAAIQVRLRGNILHVLCESSQGLEPGAKPPEQRAVLPREVVLMRLVRSLLEPAVKDRLADDFPQIHQIYVYSRRAQATKPVWSAPIYLNRLDQHLERLVEGSRNIERDASDTAHSDTAHEATQLSSPEQLLDISLAHQGDSGAIARYLSEALSALNVGVKVSARVVPGKARRIQPIVTSVAAAADDDSDELVSRLWVFCEASYSPDPLLIAEPIAERLRKLHLKQFQDAVITIQVTGEAASDWRLRVDLTPPEEMLKEWGRWGDLPALSLLVNKISQRYGLKLVTEFKKSTLHLISYPIAPAAEELTPSALSASALSASALSASLEDGGTSDVSVAQLPHKNDIDGLVRELSVLLETVAPQGIPRAMLYGPSTDDISPEWLRGVDLPAATRPDLAKSALSLAGQGDLSALAYCLTRSLNPDIKEQLATGGIRVQLLQKDKLLHVMADGPICPPKHAIVPLINQTLEQANILELSEGIRLYGRRAGQKQPIWTYGQDYQVRQRMVPEAKPEFAASEAYIGELITPVTDASLADSTPAADAAADVNITTALARALQYVMVMSQVFVPAEQASGLRSNLPQFIQLGGKRMALVWGAAGLLLAVQLDFLVGQALRQASSPAVAEVASASASPGSDSNQPDSNQLDPNQPDKKGVERLKPSDFNEELANLNWQTGDRAPGWDKQAAGAADDSFVKEEGSSTSSPSAETRLSSGDFTASAIDDDQLIYSPQQDLVSTSSLLAGSALPTFRSQQLDEKLALYRREVARSGPPDVLVIGSSRALRGVDPAALRQALGSSGHEGLSIFNFGVNGATAQVVDLVIRRLIPPDQLPQIIVWADGARAFNSGRVDVTFDAIATSEGYQQLEANSTPGGIENLALGSLSEQLTASARSADQRLSELLGRLSAGYTHRSEIRSALGQGFGAIAPKFSVTEEATQAGDTPTEMPTETSNIDADGFLALSNRFNPATYYQDHARVAGDYDGDYKAFQLEGKQTLALNDLLYYTTEKNVPIVFINTPLTDEYLDSQRTKAENSFLQYMVQTADRSGQMIFRDMGQLWPQRYDYFSDPSHLNRYGAYQVSNRLAQDPLIPWPDPLPKEE